MCSPSLPPCHSPAPRRDAGWGDQAAPERRALPQQAVQPRKTLCAKGPEIPPPPLERHLASRGALAREISQNNQPGPGSIFVTMGLRLPCPDTWFRGRGAGSGVEIPPQQVPFLQVVPLLKSLQLPPGLMGFLPGPQPHAGYLPPCSITFRDKRLLCEQYEHFISEGRGSQLERMSRNPMRPQGRGRWA